MPNCITKRLVTLCLHPFLLFAASLSLTLLLSPLDKKWIWDTYMAFWKSFLEISSHNDDRVKVTQDITQKSYLWKKWFDSLDLVLDWL